MTSTFEITTEFHPEGTHSSAYWGSKINGQGFQGLYGKTEDAARKAAERMVTRFIADDAVAPRCIEVCRTMSIEEFNGLVQASERLPQAGDVVAMFSRNRIRVGIATKVGRKNIEVAYTTPSNVGAITRKSSALQYVRFVAEGEQA